VKIVIYEEKLEDDWEPPEEAWEDHWWQDE